ncbi:MAG: prepilin-type N-terminal cleavage/methylation domain-containing protein [Verrucomicrobiales bacterium]|nr:prepilin-type N-terminal cleavage/methylation domain-containing protein [Verrucomicrobiales bacterium]
MTVIRPNRNRGLTLVEVLVVVVVLLGLFFVMTYPRLGNSPQLRASKSKRIRCLQQLKNVGLAFRIVESEHTNSSRNLPAHSGGIRDGAEDPGSVWRQVLVLSNEWATPAVLWCPADVERKPATTFGPASEDRRSVAFSSNRHLSYFLGLNASEAWPQSILAGDRNVTNEAGLLGPGRRIIASGARIGFSRKMHDSCGNVLLADGSVQQVTSSRLRGVYRDALTESGLSTNVWLFP